MSETSAIKRQRIVYPMTNDIQWNQWLDPGQPQISSESGTILGLSGPQWSNQSIDFKSPLKVVLVVVVVRPFERETQVLHQGPT